MTEEFDDRVVRLDEHRTRPLRLTALDHLREAEKALAACQRDVARLKLTLAMNARGRESRNVS
jgi:hypothetical protein